MKSLLIAYTWLLAACSFDASGLGPEADPDASAVASDAGSDQDGDMDAASAADAATVIDALLTPDAAPASAHIACSTEMLDGHWKIVLTFSGDIESGFLGAASASAPVAIEYGSDREDYAVSVSCQNTWAIPYPSGCRKPSAVWGLNPKLYLEPEADYLNVALRYADGTVRWGDLKTADGDPVGFTVSAFSPSHYCRIQVTDGGAGGYFRTSP